MEVATKPATKFELSEGNQYLRVSIYPSTTSSSPSSEAIYQYIDVLPSSLTSKVRTKWHRVEGSAFEPLELEQLKERQLRTGYLKSLPYYKVTGRFKKLESLGVDLTRVYQRIPKNEVDIDEIQ